MPGPPLRVLSDADVAFMQRRLKEARELPQRGRMAVDETIIDGSPERLLARPIFGQTLPARTLDEGIHVPGSAVCCWFSRNLSISRTIASSRR
jgi:hypothetical protein